MRVLAILMFLRFQVVQIERAHAAEILNFQQISFVDLLFAYLCLQSSLVVVDRKVVFLGTDWDVFFRLI